MQSSVATQLPRQNNQTAFEMSDGKLAVGRLLKMKGIL